jgi:P2 family phage major capsid protein
MSLSNQGRQALAHYHAELQKVMSAEGAVISNVEGGMHFAATPTQGQVIYDKVIEDGAGFLQMLNPIVPVSEIAGQKVGFGLSSRVASRTDTTGAGERTPRHLASLDQKGYSCNQIDFDVALLYSLVDTWAKFPDFAARYIRHVRQAMGNDLLSIGFNGTSDAATTDIATNPNLEDVSKGWLQIMREFGGGHYLDGTGVLTLGEGDIPNLDVLAQELKLMLPIKHRQNNGYVLLVGSDILGSQESVYYQTNGNTPTEKRALGNGEVTKAYGGFPTMYAPFFPDGTALLTPLSNLKIYQQTSSVRRTIKDKPEKNQTQDFNSVNLDWIVEDEEQAVLIDNISVA